MMKLTDTGLPDQLAREILPLGTDPKTVNKLSEQMELARMKGKISVTQVQEKRTRFNRFDREYHDYYVYVPKITLYDAAVWTQENGFSVRDELLERLLPDSNPSPPPGSGGKWPWGDYETPLLQILAEAVNHFCLADNYPKKESGEVVQWVKKRM